jgi:5-hydroxyisourate hydrolase
MSLSTHVLDATSGRPAAGISVRLEAAGDDGWTAAGGGQTGPDGRLSLAGDLFPGVYRITFGSGDYFAGRQVATFYPEVTITFEVSARDEHTHVPLLLSPFAYSTYRGS